MLTGRWCALGEVKMIDTGFLPGWIAWIGIGVPDSKYLCGMHNAKDIHLLNFVWIFESFNEEIQPDWSWKSSAHNSCRICRSLVWLGRYTHTIAMRDGGPQESEGQAMLGRWTVWKHIWELLERNQMKFLGRRICLWVWKWNCMFVSFCYVWPPLSLANVSFPSSPDVRINLRKTDVVWFFDLVVSFPFHPISAPWK